MKKLQEEKTDLTSTDLIKYLPSKCRNTDRLALNAILPAQLRFKMTDKEKAERKQRLSSSSFMADEDKRNSDPNSSDYNNSNDYSDDESDDFENDDDDYNNNYLHA